MDVNCRLCAASTAPPQVKTSDLSSLVRSSDLEDLRVLWNSRLQVFDEGQVILVGVITIEPRITGESTGGDLGKSCVRPVNYYTG